DAATPILLMAADLSPTWRGYVSLLGWAVRDDNVSTPLMMRVDGEERVRVPAGEFDCWRIAITGGTGAQRFWVRKSDGLGIRVVAAGREIVLAEER
ncbi:MAG TPA: hypothetical protein VE967_05705, partial [Gemmatimonadaceae bacterium]|nr:hypothetical protein [Gemmatimonadaceae bacterium]